MLVLDASVVIPACGSPRGFDFFGAEQLCAPPLMWSEARSAVHEALWRGQVTRAFAIKTVQALESAPVSPRSFRKLGRRAWEYSEQLGWAKTYDAEYLALAAHLGCRLVTMDGKLHKGAERLGFVIDPSEI